MTEKQEYLLRLFREIDEICKEHNLRYVMAGGSLIGVLRNEGFIPWDDDVDIYMPRDDWDKLVEIARTELPAHRALQCVDVDRSYTNTFPRYASTDTCAIHRHQLIGNDKAGEIIDVLTLDPIPADDREYEKYRTHMMIYTDLVNIAVVFGNRWEIPAFKYLRYLFSYIFLGRDRTLKKLEKIMFSYKEEDCPRYAMRWGGCPFLFDKDMMFPVKYMDFEGEKVMVPQRTSDYLIWHYGDEWSYIPPHGERESHESISVEGISYKELRSDYMPKINKFHLRFNAAVRKFYYMLLAKKSHRLTRQRDILKAKSLSMDVEARIRESGRTARTWMEQREFGTLNEIFESYYQTQLSAAFIGREDFANIYPFYHPTLVELSDNSFQAAMMTLIYTERISKAYRMYEVREKLGSLTPEMKGTKEDIERFRKAVSHYEFGEKKEAEEICADLLERYPENPGFMKFWCRLVMERCQEQGMTGEGRAFLEKALALFPQDGYFLKYQADILRMEGRMQDALSLYAEAREKTANGIVQLELDKLLKEYKRQVVNTCYGLVENKQKQDALSLAELWARLLPEDEIIHGTLCLAQVAAVGTQSGMEELVAEIRERLGAALHKVKKKKKAQETVVYRKALTLAWKRLGYPEELAKLRTDALCTEDDSELEWIAEQIRVFQVNKEWRFEIFKLLGDVRKRQGQTREAFENYFKALEYVRPSYVKTELSRIFLEDLSKGSRRAAVYAKKADAAHFLDNWLDKYGGPEDIRKLLEKIV